jgi:protein-L-isoaspartate O-methyltransferase
MHQVPRHEFVPQELKAAAYDDRPLPIGHGQTISRPRDEAGHAQPGRMVLGERVRS